MLKTDGSVINPRELWGVGWYRKVLYRARNPRNVGKLEQRIHERIDHLPLGRRLNRNIGGWKAKQENYERKFVVGVTWSERGYGNFVLNT